MKDYSTYFHFGRLKLLCTSAQLGGELIVSFGELFQVCIHSNNLGIQRFAII